MRRKRRRANLALEIIPPQRLECRGVHGERRAVLLGREQHAAPKGDVGVGGGADHAVDGLVVGPRVAVAPEECAAVFGLGVVAVGVHEALLEVCVGVGDADGGYGAVAVEVDVIFEEWGEAMVRLGIECQRVS